MGNRIIVGYDGSASSAAAAEWAAAEASVRGVPLCILTCYSAPIGVEWVAGGSAAVTYDMTEVERGSAGSGEAIAEALRSAHPQLDCAVKAILGPPREVLVEASTNAALLVVGKTGAGAAKALFLGSVANAVVRRSSCPTVLVPAESSSRPLHRRIAVGVDGSPSSLEALEWGMEEAAVRGGELLLVRSWTYTYDGPVIESADARDAACEAAQRELDEIVASARLRATGFTVRGVLVEDAAAAALLDAGESADMLVVGSRGRGGLRAMLFGSVAHALTEHATCPTVVLRHRHG